MTKKIGSSYSGKHEANLTINSDLADKINKKASEGKLACAVAFKIAEEMNKTPSEVGTALDLLDIKISKCQLGIFGYGRDNKFIRPMEDIPPYLQNIIREGMKDGKLQCIDAWKIAKDLGVGRMDVASACDRLGIKISSCQLGAF